MPMANHLIVCRHDFYGLSDSYEYSELILSLREAARRKIADKSHRMTRGGSFGY